MAATLEHHGSTEIGDAQLQSVNKHRSGTPGYVRANLLI
jgi:hypothetical protein